MNRFSLCPILFVFLTSGALAQVELDHQISLTGPDGTRLVTGLEIPTGPEDAANKAYVDGRCLEHAPGEILDGGIIFHVYRNNGEEHGYIASLFDLDEGTGYVWSNVWDQAVGPSAQSFTDGQSNTSAIISQPGHTTSAAALCANYSGGGHTDWYLPAARELALLASQDAMIDHILDNDGDPSTHGFIQDVIEPSWGYYWSSTEIYSSVEEAHAYYFVQGYINHADHKTDMYRVRCIRQY